MKNYREPRFTFGRISEEVWNRKDVVPSVVFYAGIGGLSKGAIVKKEGLSVICALLSKVTRMLRSHTN